MLRVSDSFNRRKTGYIPEKRGRRNKTVGVDGRALSSSVFLPVVAVFRARVHVVFIEDSAKTVFCGFPPAGGMRLRFRRKHRIRIPRRSKDRRRLKRKRIYHRRRGYESGRAVFVFRSVVRHRLRRRGRVRQFLRRLRSAFIAYTVRNRLRTCFQILRRIRT